MSYRYYYHTNKKSEVLAYSHYSDPAFSGEGAVIFGREVDGMRWEYADRLRQWKPEKSSEAWQAAVEKCGKQRTAARIEAYLRHYYDNDKLELLCIRSGTQPFNGYPWYAYGFTAPEVTP